MSSARNLQKWSYSKKIRKVYRVGKIYFNLSKYLRGLVRHHVLAQIDLKKWVCWGKATKAGDSTSQRLANRARQRLARGFLQINQFLNVWS